MLPSVDDINESARRILPHIHRTPVLKSEGINKIIGADIWFKCENFQKVGAFKSRGACNAVFSLSDEDVRHMRQGIQERWDYLTSLAAINDSDTESGLNHEITKTQDVLK